MPNLSIVPDLEGRQRVARALDEYDAVSERQGEATKALWATRRKLEAAVAKIDREIRRVEETFHAQYDAIVGYPDIHSPYQMHDDHLDCYRCEICGLPLRHDDKTVDYGDGQALACLATSDKS